MLFKKGSFFSSLQFSRLHFASLCCIAAIALLAVSAASAQTTSTIEGVVKDKQGLAIAGAQIHVVSPELGVDRTVTSDSDGIYRATALPPGRYEIRASKDGFQSQVTKNIELTLNITLTFDVSLTIGTVNQSLEVTSDLPLVDTTASSTGSTITPKQIEDMPINGRNYLDLLQLVPGVAVNRQNDSGGDAATPILGERGGNTLFLIDGMPNRDNLNGGPSAQFNQDSIMEFQVVTGGYEAQFGHASGGVVNVVTRGGTNVWHGGASVFHRNYKLDSNNIPDANTGSPFLLRWDPTAYLGGPILRDKIFFFGSAERILESRDLNFVFNPTIPQTLVDFETPFNKHSLTYETRGRARLDENLGHHRISEQFNYTNTHITDFLPLTASLNLPDTRQNLDSRSLMLGMNDIWTLGEQSNPWVLSSYIQYRANPNTTSPSHPDAGTPNTLFNLFDTYTSGDLFGNQGQVSFGPGYNSFSFYQKYISLGSNLSKQFGRHNIRFGWDYENTKVDGAEPNNFFTQLFSTIDDFNEFGPINSGLNLITLQGGPTPQDNIVRLRNNYNGLFVQDNWKIRQKLTLNLGLRWDYDSRFPNKTDFSPRVGAAYALNSKTVINASVGVFYDQFRAGVARDVPGFGGANILRERLLSFPRLFYGNPTSLTGYFQSLGRPTVCVSNNLTQAQVMSTSAPCLDADGHGTGGTLYGIDYLNGIVAPGHAPIPGNSLVNIGNIQQLSGYTPDEYLAAADAAVANLAGSTGLTVPANYWSWDSFGNLTTIDGILGTSGAVPVSVDPNFKVPYTLNYHVGVQRQIGTDMALTFDYYHKDIKDILTVRSTNLAFEARIPGFTNELIPGTGAKKIVSFGPWGAGTYDGFTIGFQKRMSHHFTLQANYTYAHDIDDVINSTLVSEIQTGQGVNFLANAGLTDSFVGNVPVVTDPGVTDPMHPENNCPSHTNAQAAFIACNGNPVPKAGTFYNGAKIDKGPSDLALNHTFLLHGIYQLPWQLEFSGIFRAQSGFHYSESPSDGSADVDGDGLFNGLDYQIGRNTRMAPVFVNMDMRISKRFNIGEHVKAQVLFEMFNLFNRDNPAAVQGLSDGNPPLGTTLQYLPGREGQVGLRIEF